MARKNASGFKMKSSPAKNLGNFFGSIFSSKAVKGTGEQLQKGQKERGVFSETAKAEKKEMRKTGESKFQYDVRKKREKKAEAKKDYKKRTSGIDPTNKTGMVNVVIDGVVTSVPAEDRFKYESVKRVKSKSKSKTKEPSKAGGNPEAKQTFKQAFASASQAGKKTFDWNGNPYTTELKENKNKYDDLFDVPFNPNLKYDQYDSEGNPIQKKSPYKKGIGSYTKKAKGSRGYKMKRNK